VLTELEPATQKVSERRRIADQNSKADKSQIREMLAVIPKRPDYADWIKVVAAIGDALPEDDAIEVLCEWSPEEREGEYADKLKKRLSDVHVGTLIHLAKQHGWTPSEAGFSADADTQASKRVELPLPTPPFVPPPLDLLPQEVRRYIAAGAKTFDVDV